MNNDIETTRACSQRPVMLLAALVCAMGTTVAQAQTVQPPGIAPPASEIDHATLAWLDLQSSNRYAAEPQPMLGAAASLAYKRYLDSFKSKIPVFFESVSGSGGSSGGNSQTPNLQSQ